MLKQKSWARQSEDDAAQEKAARSLKKTAAPPMDTERLLRFLRTSSRSWSENPRIQAAKEEPTLPLMFRERLTTTMQQTQATKIHPARENKANHLAWDLAHLHHGKPGWGVQVYDVLKLPRLACKLCGTVVWETKNRAGIRWWLEDTGVIHPRDCDEVKK